MHVCYVLDNMHAPANYWTSAVLHCMRGGTHAGVASNGIAVPVRAVRITYFAEQLHYAAIGGRVRISQVVRCTLSDGV